MLVLSRKAGESVVIGSDIRVTVVSASGGQVRLAIEAPQALAVHREEVVERIAEANRAAAESVGAASGPDGADGGAPAPDTHAAEGSAALQERGEP